MNTAGELLRTARITKSLQIDQVSEATKIRPSLLKSLEDDDYAALPSEFCVRSFTRQYATYLGLDADEVAKAVPVEKPRSDLDPPVEPDDGLKIPTGFFVAKALRKLSAAAERSATPLGTGLVAVILIVGGAYWWWIQAPVEGEPTPAPPAEQTMDSFADPPEQTPVSEASAPSESPSPPEPVSGLAEPTVSEPSTGPADPQQLVAGKLNVSVEATSQVWVRWLADGTNARSGLLDAGQRRTIVAQRLVQMTLGNAGSARISINGEPRGAAGEAGQVRHLEITSDGWKFLPADSF